ncbi:MAG: hypothetical protein V3V61_04760, partial [Gammaproteobacteria bacterium]
AMQNAGRNENVSYTDDARQQLSEDIRDSLNKAQNYSKQFGVSLQKVEAYQKGIDEIKNKGVGFNLNLGQEFYEWLPKQTQGGDKPMGEAAANWMITRDPDLLEGYMKQFTEQWTDSYMEKLNNQSEGYIKDQYQERKAHLKDNENKIIKDYRSADHAIIEKAKAAGVPTANEVGERGHEIKQEAQGWLDKAGEAVQAHRGALSEEGSHFKEAVQDKTKLVGQEHPVTTKVKGWMGFKGMDLEEIDVMMHEKSDENKP